MKKVILMALVTLGLLVQQAHAYDVNALLTADNHYGLYFGNEDGTSLSLVGRNEVGYDGNPDGTYNWSVPENYSFNTGNDQYLYVLAWDDKTVTQSWIGQFNGSDFEAVYTNLDSWEYMVAAGSNPGDNGALPLLSTVQSDIFGANWATPTASTPQAGSTWGVMSGISPEAQYIWHDTFDNNATASREHYAIFRTELEPILTPEPAALMLYGIGGLPLAFSFLRRKKTV